MRLLLGHVALFLQAIAEQDVVLEGENTCRCVTRTGSLG